jgi:hypothetical protein
LTFDTNTNGCSYGENWPFWAWGTSPNSANDAAYRVDADAMTTVGDLSSSHDSPIERWITEYSIPTRLENYIAELDQTQLLTEMLAGQVIRRDIIINFNEDIARAFTEMNPDSVVGWFIRCCPAACLKSCWTGSAPMFAAPPGSMRNGHPVV